MQLQSNRGKIEMKEGSLKVDNFGSFVRVPCGLEWIFKKIGCNFTYWILKDIFKAILQTG